VNWIRLQVARVTRATAGLDLGITASYRSLSLAGGMVVNFLAVAMLTSSFGAGGYASFALIASLLSALPFADLGLGVALVNASVDYKNGAMSAAAYKRVLVRVVVLLALVAFLLEAINVALLLSGSWASLLGQVGSERAAEIYAFVTMSLFSVALPLGFGGRLLQGLGLVRLSALTGVFGPIVQGGVILTLWLVEAPAPAFALGPAAALVFTAAAQSYLGLSRLNAISSKYSRDGAQAAAKIHRIASSAVPFVLISIGGAVAFQLGRLVLAQFSTPLAVAQYSLVAQFTVPINSVLALMGQSLWPRYRSELVRGTLRRRLFLGHISIFGSLGLLAGAGATCASLWLGPVLSGGEVIPPLLCALAGGAQLFIFSLVRPAGMLLNEPRGLWAQAVAICVMAALNLPLAIWLTGIFGAAGPFLATAIAVATVQLPLLSILASRRIRFQ
jgi:O-antigen/teichoic acid export membrane protein